jgi:uncharacterized protein (TIGR03435 family)
MFFTRAALVSILASLPAVCQTPAFEVVSVKKSVDDNVRGIGMKVSPGGRVSAPAVPLLFLLSYAYNVPLNPSPRLSGVPDWAIRERYDIEAKPALGAFPAGLTESQAKAKVQAMIRGLLADRFKLVMKTESKEMPVYALTVGAGGPKLQKAGVSEKDCTLEAGESNKEDCHNIHGGMGRGMTGKAVSTGDIAAMIENWTDHPVIDRTGLDGLYAIQTEGWVPMALPPPPPPTAGGPAPNPRPSGDGDMSDPSRPTLFVILRRLGLELKQQKGPVSVYTIEHIERPAAN